MLLRFDSFEALDFARLMTVYRESNRENAEEFYPEMDAEKALHVVEENFRSFLQDTFYQGEGKTYWVLCFDDVWVSALRLTQLWERFYYLEALETHPAFRIRGYAKQLLRSVIEQLEADGPVCICDCVDKENTASVRTHLAAGFRICSEAGYDYLQQEAKDWEYGFAYGKTEDAKKSL